MASEKSGPFNEKKDLKGPSIVRKVETDEGQEPSPAVREIGDRAVDLAARLSRPRVMVDAHGVVMTPREIAAVQSGASPDARK